MPVATTTARLRTSLPSAAVTTSSEPSGRNPEAELLYVLRAEGPGLRIGPKGQVRAAHPGWETKVVADHRAGAGLPAHGLRLHSQRRQALRRAVYRRRQAGGPAPITVTS